MTKQKKIDFVPPLAGERVGTPDGEGIVIGTTTFWEHPKRDDQEWIRNMRARMGKDFHKRYFKATVEVEDDMNEYECWELEWDSDRDLDAPWR